MKKRLLLDVCCGPCATHVIQELIPDYDVTLFYDNSNIFPIKEHKKRLQEAQKLARAAKLNLIVTTYEHERWLAFIEGYEKQDEGGERCELCYTFRIGNIARYASENRFDYFSTTLTVSPHKDAEIINIIGKNASRKYNVKFHEADFKKNSGFQKSVALSRKMKLYRQHYCGCEFSRSIASPKL